MSEPFARLRAMAEDYRGGQVRPSEPEVELIGRHGAVASVLLRGTETDSAGETRHVVGVTLTLVFERIEGEWEVVQAHESSALGEEPLFSRTWLQAGQPHCPFPGWG